MTTRRLVIGVLLSALVVLGSACGSSSVVGTRGEPATTATGPLVADLECASQGEAVAGMSTTATSATSAEALHQYLASAPAASTLRQATFAPAQPPPGFGPVQGVTQATAVEVSTTSVAPTSTAPVHLQWYAHRGADGRVTAAISTSDAGRGWTVDAFEYCQPDTRPPDGATATTASVPVYHDNLTSVPPQASTTIYPGRTTTSEGSAVSTIPASTTSTTSMSGP